MLHLLALVGLPVTFAACVLVQVHAPQENVRCSAWPFCSTKVLTYTQPVLISPGPTLAPTKYAATAIHTSTSLVVVVLLRLLIDSAVGQLFITPELSLCKRPRLWILSNAPFKQVVTG